MKNTMLLLIGAILIGLMGVGCQQETEQAAEPAGPVVDSVASADSLIVKYEVVGQGDPALVFVHGWSCDRTYWKNQVPDFAGKYKVVTVDVGGHGESGMNREVWTMASYGSDVAAVVNKLGLQKVILIGHSMGGLVNLHAASQLGDKVLGIVGVDNYQDFSFQYTPEQSEAFVAPFKADFPTTTRAWVASMFSETADTALKNWVIDDMSQASSEVALGAFESLVATSLVEVLKGVDVPIRTISSDKWPTNVEGNRAYAESFDIKLMPGMGHFIHMEDPPRFNLLLQQWIDELTGQDGVDTAGH